MNSLSSKIKKPIKLLGIIALCSLAIPLVIGLIYILGLGQRGGGIGTMGDYISYNSYQDVSAAFHSFLEEYPNYKLPKEMERFKQPYKNVGWRHPINSDALNFYFYLEQSHTAICAGFAVASTREFTVDTSFTAIVGTVDIDGKWKYDKDYSWNELRTIQKIFEVEILKRVRNVQFEKYGAFGITSKIHSTK